MGITTSSLEDVSRPPYREVGARLSARAANRRESRLRVRHPAYNEFLEAFNSLVELEERSRPAMLSFEQFIADAASKGEAVNTLFEERLFGLVGVLHKITDALTAEQIPHEVIGGLAVLIHVEEANPEQTALTRDVDLMVLRSDLERIKSVAARRGFRFRHVAGVDMLIYGDAEPAKNAVHLIFSGEKFRPNYVAPTPAIEPEAKRILGKEVMVIPVADLVGMKLTSFRLKDQVHVQSLDAVALVREMSSASLRPNYCNG
jgi:hypothetical protein